MSRHRVWVAAVTAASVVASMVVMTSDFEDGTGQGWFGRGSAVLAATTDAAHAGTQSLRVTGRTATWNGPGRTVLGIVRESATFADGGRPAVGIDPHDDAAHPGRRLDRV